MRTVALLSTWTLKRRAMSVAQAVQSNALDKRTPADLFPGGWSEGGQRPGWLATPGNRGRGSREIGARGSGARIRKI